MTTVGSSQVKSHLPELIERVACGESTLITCHGVPVAMLTPPLHRASDIRQVVEDILAFRDRFGTNLGRVNIRELIEDGRRY